VPDGHRKDAKLKPPADVEGLRQLLSDSTLLEGEPLAQASRLAADFSSENVNEFAAALVQAALLTTWQAKEALAGRRLFRIARYLLLDELGRGGMGSLFRARQAVTNRIVALKIIRERDAGKELMQKRFNHEIEALARLDHSNVVGIIDAGCGDPAFLVMPLVEGNTLEELAERLWPMPVAHACEYCRQAAWGLQHAQDQGVVHRDIKPANLMVTWPAADRPLVRIVDFGIARLSGNSTLTQPGVGLGSLAFMAPEQLADPHNVDSRADIYSLGATLLYVLTRERLGGNSVKQVIESRRSDVPAGLVHVLERMLAREPDLRYDTPLDVAYELETYSITPETRLAVGAASRRESSRLKAPAFHAAAHVPPDFFIDRERERERALRLISSGEGFLVVGRRRSGKTSFCHKLMAELRATSSSLFPTYVNLIQYSSLHIETFLEHTILNALGEIGREVFGCDWALLKESNPKTFKPGLADDPAFGPFHRLFQLVTQRTHAREGAEPAPFLVSDFVHFMHDLLSVMRTKGFTNLVVFYDEANRLSRDISVDLLLGIEEALHNAGVIGVYAASQEMAQTLDSLRELFVEEVRIGPFEDIKHLFRLLSRYYFDDGDGQRINDLPTQRQAVEMLWAISEGEPFLIQYLARETFRRANESLASEVLPSHVTDAYKVLRSQSPHLFSRE
jgi:serine/threonine protein kinase